MLKFSLENDTSSDNTNVGPEKESPQMFTLTSDLEGKIKFSVDVKSNVTKVKFEVGVKKRY